MELEVGFIAGISFGVEYQELDKGYFIIDLGIIRFLFSRPDPLE